jgi:serine/threonine-protein kinase RsbW
LKHYNIVLESSRSEVSRIEGLLGEINSDFKLEMERFINFQIAASEALVNAIVHGNKEDKNKKVYVDISQGDKELQIKIKDEGSGFDVNKVPDPTNEENILKENGRGIYIIRSLVDEFKCESSAKGTEMTLKVIKR